MPSENTEKRENEIPASAAPAPEQAKASPAFPESDKDHAVFLKRNQLSATPAVPADKLTPTRGRSTKQFTALFGILLPAISVLAVLAGICWALTCLLSFDWELGHPAAGSVWYILTIVLLALGLVCTGLLALRGRRTRQYRYPVSGMGETFCAFLAAALFGIGCLRQVYDLFFTAPESVSALSSDTLNRLAVLSLLFCVLYFLFVGLNKTGGIMSLLSMASCLAVMLTLFRDYFDFTLPLNSPLRNLSTLVYAALLLFFLAEARMHTDLWYTGVPFSVLAYASVILLAGSVGLGQAVSALTGNTAFSLIEQAAFLAAAGLSYCRLKQLPSLIADYLPPPPTEDEIKKAEKRLAK